MIDTHCHIDMYPNPKSVANEAEKAGIITIGMTNLPSHFELGYKHLKEHKKVRLALGMHPLYANLHEKELPLFKKYKELTSYIGEIGLDFSQEGIATKDIQLHAFKSILESIKSDYKILSLHSRKAEKEVLSLIKAHQIKAAIFHWYSGPVSIIEDIVTAGYYFSINASMIKSKNGQEIIRRIPQSNILTESDGPFLKYKGRSAKPSDVKPVIEYLAQLWMMSVKHADDVIHANFNKLLQPLKL